MKSTRKVLILMLALMLMLGTVSAASAKISINFTFTDIKSNYDSDVGTVTDDASSFYLTLGTSSTVSNINVFGYRARFASTGNKASSYYTINYVGKKTGSFKSSVSAGDKVFFRCKKDDSSTYGGPLNADGSFQP